MHDACTKMHNLPSFLLSGCRLVIHMSVLSLLVILSVFRLFYYYNSSYIKIITIAEGFVIVDARAPVRKKGIENISKPKSRIKIILNRNQNTKAISIHKDFSSESSRTLFPRDNLFSSTKSTALSAAADVNVEIPILLETDHILVVNKPSGIPHHNEQNDGVGGGETLGILNVLRQQ